MYKLLLCQHPVVLGKRAWLTVWGAEEMAPLLGAHPPSRGPELSSQTPPRAAGPQVLKDLSPPSDLHWHPHPHGHKPIPKVKTTINLWKKNVKLEFTVGFA